MKRGWVNLSVIPGRSEASDASEMITQLLFGEAFEILEEQENWIKIKGEEDDYVCWIGDKQFLPLEENPKGKKTIVQCPSQLISPSGDCIWLNVGSIVYLLEEASDEEEFGLFDVKYKVQIASEKWDFQGDLGSLNLEDLCRSLLNVPYLWGGKNLMGIDCSGFTQVVFRAMGIRLNRDASQQFLQGEEVLFDQMQKGDLAFFANDKGAITHVGIILEDQYIIHASGKVRIDELRAEGIWHVDDQKISHHLCGLKRIR